MALVWIATAFVAGTLVGIFSIALAQAAARGDRREPSKVAYTAPGYDRR